jgi:syntaxin 8
MGSTNPAQLFLLADHIKLSLLERQRAISLNLSPNSQDAQISRSLDTLESGVTALEAQLSTAAADSDSGSADPAARQQLDQLRTHLRNLSVQFHGARPATAAATMPAERVGSPRRSAATVRFADAPSSDPAAQARRAELFPYRDDPDEADDAVDASELTNAEIHEYHQTVMEQQDEQLDELGQSIGRQRELTIAIGNELDDQVFMLDDVDERVDRHQSRLDGAARRLGAVVRKAKENWSMTTIFVLIIVLVLLIVITKK